MLSADAQVILKIMRREWEMATRDLREESGIAERARFDKGHDSVAKALKIIPTEVLVRADVYLHLVDSRGAFSGATQAERGKGRGVEGDCAVVSGRSGDDFAKGIGACDWPPFT